MDIYRFPTLCHLDTKNPSLIFVYIVAGLFVFQTLLVSYANSTYLEQFIGARGVSVSYSVGALLSLVLFIVTPRLLRRFGNVAVIISYATLLIISLLLLGLAWSPVSIVGAFLAFLAVSPLIYLNIDVFAETIIGTDESETGTKRGVLLAIMSTAALLAPLSMSGIAGAEGALHRLYFTALGTGVVIVVIIVAALRRFYDPPYDSNSFFSTWRSIKTNTNLTIVFAAHFLLQLFFTWAVIYIPLYLATVAQFNWSEIGLIIAAGLAAFVLIELPVGYIADHYIGEKEMMAGGFVVLAIATGLMGSLASYGLLGAMALMFVSRVGASLVEATTETYFFKATTGENGSVISLFRMIRPVANLTGAIVGSICLLILPLSLTFTVFACILASGAFITQLLVDTR